MIDNFYPTAIIGLLPLVRNRVCLSVLFNGIRQQGRLKAPNVLYHQYRLTSVVNKIVFKVITEVGWWKIHFNTYLGETALDKFKGRYKITVCTYKSHNIGEIHHTVLYHSD